nr:small subunit processome component 20 homolog [Halyomorpha halys]
MKNKPHRHKESNVFKFIPFSERIGKVKIDVVHQIKHKYELDICQTSTHLFQAYEKWISLNSSQSFTELRKEITYDIKILPQLLVRKEELVNILEKHLASKNPLNLQPTLDFVVALANDLRQEFFPYFSSIYKLLVDLLNSKDADQLESVFQCLAYLFKLLWRYLINELPSVFESLVPLLDKSKPTYINNFAAQSFAFVARKVKDHSKLIKLIIRTLKEKPEAVEGFGRLMFEIVHGIHGQWHSCGEKIFTSLISALKDPSYPHDILYELLSHTLAHLVPFLTVTEHNKLLWKILQTTLSDLCKELQDDPNERTLANAEQALFMIQQAVEYKKCFALIEPAALLKQLLELIQTEKLTDHICSIISYILLNASKLPQELSSSTIIGALGSLEGKALLEFALQIRTYAGFEGIVLPRMLNYCLENVDPLVALQYIARLAISKAPPAEDSRQLLVYRPYSINFSSTRKGNPALFGTFYLSLLKDRTIQEHLEHFDDCIMILLVLPHLLPLQKAEAVAVIVSLMETACVELDSNKKENSRKVLYLMCAALEAIMCLKPETCITKLVPPEKILPSLIKHGESSENIFALRALDFYISLDELNLVLPFADELKKSLYPLLRSPYQMVRSHITHIFYEVEKSKGLNNLMSSVLETCWSAECVPPILSKYRHRLKILRKLDCSSSDTLQNAVEKGIVDGRIPLRYLLGHLFINFRLLWEPVSSIIVDYSCVMEPEKFWEIYREQMDWVAKEIQECKLQSKQEPLFVCEDLQEMFTSLNDVKEKPDYIKYRIMLWNMLKKFPDTIYEAKSKDIVIRFLDFIEMEYNKRYSEAATSWNIRQKSVADMSLQDIDMLMEIEEEAKDSEQNEEPMEEESPVNESLKNHDTSLTKQDVELKKELIEEPVPESEWKTKWVTKSLVAHMGIFSKFRSPKSLYRESEVNKLFYEFLSSRVPEVQKCALDFIMQYKFKYLIPYKDNVYGLIDDKTFKNELTLFRVDSQSDAVKPEHRDQLIPIILRIVYSKMYSKVNTSKRETKQARKAAVLRFLSGCSSEELFNFFRMTFSLLADLVEDDATTMVNKIIDSFDLEHCTPPRRLMATTHLLKTVLTYCGGLLEPAQTKFLLRLILIVASHLPPILNKREEVHPGYIKVIKNVRAVCFNVTSQFYEIYEDYNWSEDEINAVFQVLVWPYLHNLPVEAVNSPTAQFKLFNTWSKNPKHLRLLNKKDENGRSVLSTITDLWGSPKLHGSVHNTILEMVQRLLLEEDETGETVSGMEILSDYIPKILKILQDRLKVKKSLTRRELQVLSIITSSPTENISSETLLSFILPSLLKNYKKDDEEITQLLTASNNLMKGVVEPGPYLRQIVPLFSSLSSPPHRKLLVSLTLDISQRSKVMMGMKEKDLSLKDTARHCLHNLCPRVCLKHSADKAELGFLLNDVLFPLLSSGINGKIEHLRQEAILILGHMVRECSSLHYVFSDLYPLSCKSDMEVDFFENLMHIQLHRRVRAMLRFSEVSIMPENTWNPKTLMNFVYPMISYFLLTPKYAEKNTVIDSTIKAVGSLCRLLPWKYYSAILRNYLAKLKSSTDYQKQITRLVSEILNAFHFDLSEAGNFTAVESLKTEEIIDIEESDKLEESVVTEEIDGENSEEKISEGLRDQPLSKQAAEKVVNELAGAILPNLQSLMAHKNVADSYHKVNKKTINFEKDEEDILRAPLAIAIVKLLQKLPSPTLLKRNLPGVLLKLCNLLKSHGEAVRRTARTTLQTVMVSLGPKYLHMLLSELASLLTRGFQVHVLAYTVHSVLQALRPMYTKGDLDSCIHKALQVCTTDLFGNAAEEKEVNQITAKTVEARVNRSFDIFHILATYTSEKYLLDILLPLKQELSRTVSSQTITKVTNCLQQVALGLTENRFLEPEELLEFAHGVSTESIPALISKQKVKVDPKQLEYESRRGPDIFLIPEEPKRKKALMSSECSKTNDHLLVEFGLKLLYFLLKREKLKKEKSKSMLDPLVKHLLDCIESHHVKICTLAIQCIPWLSRMQLPSINLHLNAICAALFQILHRFASAGLSKGDNFHLVMAAFKTVGALVREEKGWKISSKDTRVLLLYCEQDIEDRERQATAFTLLKALIARHIKADEMSSIMDKVAKISIISQMDSVRLQARQVMLTYLMEYTLGEEVSEFLSFYLQNLDYDIKTGRESGLEMISMLVAAFPLEQLQKDAYWIYLDVTERLVKDLEPDIKRKAASIICQLIKKLDVNSRDMLFDRACGLVETTEMVWRLGGMQLIGLFANTEKVDFTKRLDSFFPLVMEEFRIGFKEKIPGKFVLIIKPKEAPPEITDRLNFLLTFMTLSTIIKVFSVCLETAVKNDKYKEYVDTIRDECQTLLAYDHEWVRVKAVQLIGLILKARNEGVTKSLVLDLTAQLWSTVHKDLLQKVVMLLLYTAEHVSALTDDNPEKKEVSLPWLVKKVRHAVNREVILSPTEYWVRIYYCRWAAVLGMKLNREPLLEIASDLLTPIVKEQSSDKEDLSKAIKAAERHLKDKIGQAEYSAIVSRISATLQTKRAVRKTERAQLAVTDPEKAAKIKMNKQIKKKVLKKRKMELIKGHKFIKKRKTEIDLEDN